MVFSTLAREAFLKVDISLYFHGFMIDLLQKEDILCHILNMRLKTKILNSHCAGWDILKMGQLKIRTYSTAARP